MRGWLRAIGAESPDPKLILRPVFRLNRALDSDSETDLGLAERLDGFAGLCNCRILENVLKRRPRDSYLFRVGWGTDYSFLCWVEGINVCVFNSYYYLLVLRAGFY